MKVKSESEVAESRSTLRDPMDCSSPGSSVHGIFQARLCLWGIKCEIHLWGIECEICLWGIKCEICQKCYISYLLELDKISEKIYSFSFFITLYWTKKVLGTRNSIGIKIFLTGQIFPCTCSFIVLVTCSFIAQKYSWENFSNSIIIITIATCWVPLLC